MPASVLDYTLRLWRTQTGAALTTLSGIGSNVVAFDPSGRWLAYNIKEMVIVIADAQSLAVVQTLGGHTSTVISLHFSPLAPDGSTRLVSCGWDGAIRVWDVERGECLQTLQVPGPMRGCSSRVRPGSARHSVRH